MKNAYLISNENITVFFDGQVYALARNNKHADKVIQLIKEGKFEQVANEINLLNSIRSYVKGAMEIIGNGIYYNGKPVHNALVQRILNMKAEGFSIEPMLKFLENLLQNPSASSREELYGFLEVNDIPITDDGCFLAYKKVRHNWTDVHSGKYSNKVGNTLSMPREEVDADRNKTCSTGFHFCGLSYLAHFSGERLISVKINPRDVVSIPIDYDNAKGRCCIYQVVAELSSSLLNGEESAWKDSVVSSNVGRYMLTSGCFYYSAGDWVLDSREASTYDYDVAKAITNENNMPEDIEVIPV